MIGALEASRLVKEARLRAGLSQRALAARADTAQSLVSQIERGIVSPTTGTLDRLLEAAGFELHSDLSPRPVLDSHMLSDVHRILSLSPEDRLIEIRNLNRLEAAVRHG